MNKSEVIGAIGAILAFLSSLIIILLNLDCFNIQGQLGHLFSYSLSVSHFFNMLSGIGLILIGIGVIDFYLKYKERFSIIVFNISLVLGALNILFFPDLSHNFQLIKTDFNLIFISTQVLLVTLFILIFGVNLIHHKEELGSKSL